MKNISSVFVLLLCFNSVIAQEFYFWADNQKYPLNLYSDMQYILIEDKHMESIAENLGIQELEVSGLKRLKFSKTVNYIDGNNLLNKENLYWGFVNQSISKDRILLSELIYAAPSFFLNGYEVGLSQFFYVKIKQKQDIEILKDLAKKNKVEIVGNDSFMPLWYILSCDKNSEGNALEMANLFYETGNFTSAQPDFLVDYGANCRNDTFFDQQWHLNNTGQFGGTLGNDIKICHAWDITMGCGDIVVAVLDHGLEFNHPDFNNISPISFNTDTGNQPSEVLGDHGVAVAGIIGASTNNGLGIAGVAPNIQLMSISSNLQLEPLVSQRLSNGINFAWQNGADVINNSWGHNALPQQGLINDAINNAVTQGRGGLGTIVVFATGNDDSNTISFPSNNPQVIAVGAMSMCNQRKSPTSCDGENTWGSNFGAGLDVMAPGVLISTTDRQGVLGYNPNIAIHPGNGGNLVANDYADQNYTTWFNGTSSAAPQVSGIAALILSVNPNLTLQQVRSIIESTTDKIGSYTYTAGAGEQATLTWNSEMGYGRVNAFAAVQAALPTISGSDFLCSTSTYSLQNPPAGSTVSWSVSPTHLFSGATSGSGTTANLNPASSAASGQAILTFEVTTTCGVISVDKRIWVGNATVNDITFSNSVDEFQHWCSSDDGNTFSINSLLDPDNTQWEARLLNWPSLTVAYTSPSVYTGAGPHQWFYVPPFPTQNNGYYVFQVRNINACTPSHWIPGFEVEYVDCTIFGGDPFRIYPNPTTDYVTVSKISHQKLGEEIQRDQTSFEVSLFDALGQEIISRAAATDEATLDLSKLKKGRYYIHIYYKEAIIRKQIKVE